VSKTRSLVRPTFYPAPDIPKETAYGIKLHFFVYIRSKNNVADNTSLATTV
jgi:hypothetical protein